MSKKGYKAWEKVTKSWESVLEKFNRPGEKLKYFELWFVIQNINQGTE